MPPWAKRGLEGITWNLVAYVAMALAAAVWTLVTGQLPHGSSWASAVGVFLAVFALLLLVANQLAEYMSRMQRVRRNTATSQQIVMQLREWLVQLRFPFVDFDLPNASFCLSCEDQYKRRFQIYQNRNQVGSIHITSMMKATEQEKKVFNQSPLALSNMRTEMARLGVYFDGILSPLDVVTVHVVVPWNESLTPFALQERIGEVLRAIILINELTTMEMEKAKTQSGPLPPATSSPDVSSASAEDAGSASQGPPVTPSP